MQKIGLWQTWTYARTLPGWVIAMTAALLLVGGIIMSYTFRPQLKFIWHAFIAPIGHTEHQQTRLDKVLIDPLHPSSPQIFTGR